MATFHRMTDESGARGDPLLRQGRARPAARARVLAPRPGAGDRARSTTRFKARYLGENERLAAQGLRVMATARRDFDAADFDPGADLLALMDGPHAAGAGRDRRSAAAGGQGRDRHRALRRHPGPDDHRRPRDHRRGDRARARHRGPRDLRRAVRRARATTQADEQIDDIGVIARVTPEQKVRLVDILKRKGHVVGDDRRRRQRRAGAQAVPTSASRWASPAPRSPRRPRR